MILDTSSTRVKVNSNGSQNDAITPWFFNPSSDFHWRHLFTRSVTIFCSSCALSHGTNENQSLRLFNYALETVCASEIFLMILTPQIPTWSATGSLLRFFFDFELPMAHGAYKWGWVLLFFYMLLFVSCHAFEVGFVLVERPILLASKISTNGTMILNNFHQP